MILRGRDWGLHVATLECHCTVFYRDKERQLSLIQRAVLSSNSLTTIETPPEELQNLTSIHNR
jgi:hypothetical protein